MKAIVTSITLSAILVSAAACVERHKTVVPASVVIVDHARLVVVDTITSSASQRNAFFSRDPDRTISVRYRTRVVIFDAAGKPTLSQFYGGIEAHAPVEGPLLEPKIWLEDGRLQLWDAATLKLHLLQRAPLLCRDGLWMESANAPAQVLFYLCSDGGMYRFDDPSGRYSRIDLTSAGLMPANTGDVWPIDRILAKPGDPNVVVQSGRRLFVGGIESSTLKEWSQPIAMKTRTGTYFEIVDYEEARQLFLAGDDWSTQHTLMVIGPNGSEVSIALPDIVKTTPRLAAAARVMRDPNGVFWFAAHKDDPNEVELLFLHLDSGEISRLRLPNEDAS